MTNSELNLKLPPQYSEEDLLKKIRSKLRLKTFHYRIIKKSLDSRKKDFIHWQIRVLVDSAEIPNPPGLEIPRLQTSRKVLVAGSGPAGIFSALYLQKAGFHVTLIERGKEVRQRSRDIEILEQKGLFTKESNYSFGEGGAGTFSDGKLSSRSKHIKKEKQYILNEFVKYGAPEEILYLAHPHIGSDKLIVIAENMRKDFLEKGGMIQFETKVTDIHFKEKHLSSVATDKGEVTADYFILATGHSALDSSRMLINRGVPYQAKNFAIGFRMEHTQELINRIQWAVPELPGVKAAEYRLTSGAGELPVYTFCMCPGGKIVPAAAFEEGNIVNGMSLYKRNSPFANAALVAGISPELIQGSGRDPLASLEWLEKLETSFKEKTGDFRAPSMTIKDFLNNDASGESLKSSYAPGLYPCDLSRLLPEPVTASLRSGLHDICRRMKGWDEGQLLGLESKTSSPIQVLRNRESALVEGFDNLFICGEASGWSGGIISSASDGLKSAMALSASLL